MSDRSFFDSLFKNFILSGAVTIIVFIIDKTFEHNDEIKELFSRLEECEKNHESSHELKK